MKTILHIYELFLACHWFFRIMWVSCKWFLRREKNTFLDPSTPIHFVLDVERYATGLQRNNRIRINRWTWKNVKIKRISNHFFWLILRNKKRNSNLHNAILPSNSCHLYWKKLLLFDIFQKVDTQDDLCHYLQISSRQIINRNW